MKTLKLNDDLYYIGVVDPQLKIFDVVVETAYGSSFNSYLLKTKKGVILFETAKEKDFDTYLANINAISNIDDVRYLVMNHAEPDHSGCIKRLLEVNPNITIIGSRGAITNIKEVSNTEFNSIIAKPTESMNFGNYSITFVKAPFLHWPDTMYTYINELNALVTCDSFGCHFAHPGILLSNLRKELRPSYEDAMDFYIKIIFGPFLKYLAAAIATVETMDIDIILPGHGPVIDKHVKEMINFVKARSVVAPIRDEAVIIYSSAYGYTKELAKSIEATLKERNIAFSSYEVDVRNYDQLKEELVEKVDHSKYVFLGSPTLNNDCLPIFRDLLVDLLANKKRAQTAMTFGSYGWTGEAVKYLDIRLNELKFKVAPNFINKFRPTEDDVKLISHMAFEMVTK